MICNTEEEQRGLSILIGRAKKDRKRYCIQMGNMERALVSNLINHGYKITYFTDYSIIWW
jgi:hypothetical protein